MSAIQTLPFGVDENPPLNTNDYEEQVGRTYASHGPGNATWRLVKIDAGLDGQVVGGKALVGVGGTFLANAIAGANAAANTLLGVAHPSLKQAVATGDYVLVQWQGQIEATGDGGVDLVAGAAVGTDATGLMDAGATTTIGQVVNDQGGISLDLTPDAIRIELDASLYVPGV